MKTVTIKGIASTIATLVDKCNSIPGMTPISEFLSPGMKLRRTLHERLGDRSLQILVDLVDGAGVLKEVLYEGSPDALDARGLRGRLEGRRLVEVRLYLDHQDALVVLVVTDDPDSPSWEGCSEELNTAVEVLATHPGGTSFKEVELGDPLRWEGNIAKILPRTGWSELEFLRAELEFDKGGIKPSSGISLGLR